MEKSILTALKGKITPKTPVWMMRQAGRYLPEYRKLRATAGGFLDLVYNPDFASEVTVQPIRRFEMDAAILFSDILVIPHALGQDLKFVKGEGPKLGELDINSFKPDRIHDTLNPIYETVSKTKAMLSEEGFSNTALIGFAGAPWTVICYMIEGQGSKDFLQVKAAALKNPEWFSDLLDVVVHSTAEYLIKQIDAGAEVIKIFDSWSGLLDEDLFDKFVIQPTKQIVDTVREKHPATLIIGFPRGSGFLSRHYVEKTGVTAIATDPSMPLLWIQSDLQSKCCVQGNLDPAYLLAGGDKLVKQTERILSVLSEGPYIFNLGHGINKDTPIEHVELMVKTIRDFKN